MSTDLKYSPDDLLLAPEAGEVLQLSSSTMSRMRSNGTGPTFTKLGTGRRCRIAYRRSDLEAWLQQQRFRSTSEYDR